MLIYIPLLFVFTAHLANGLPHRHSTRNLDQDDFGVLERRDVVRRSATASSCSKLDLDDVQSLPGWDKLEQHARSTWGDGDWTISINPDGYRDKPATLCVVDPVKIEVTGEPNCNESREDIPPDKKNSNVIKVNEGYTNTGNWNITNATSAAHAQFFSAKFLLPNITSLSLNSLGKPLGKFINAPENSFVTTASNVTIKPTDITPVPDKHCIGTIMEKRCSTPAKGSIQFVATGYIWFNYKSKRAPLANPKGGKHFKYTVKIEDVLKNATERSAWINFNGVMNTTWRYDYFDECRWNFKLD